MLAWGVRQWRRIISRRLAGESTLFLAFGDSLGEEAREVLGRGDEPARRGDGIGGVAAGNRHAAPQRQLARMAECQGCVVGNRHVGLSFPGASRRDDLALDPGLVGLSGNSFDRKAKQGKAMVRVLETRAGVDHGSRARSAITSSLLGAPISDPVRMHIIAEINGVAPGRQRRYSSASTGGLAGRFFRQERIPCPFTYRVVASRQRQSRA